MERSDKQRKPVAVKNLAELKRFIQPGVEFKTLSQKNHPDLVGLTRVVTTVQTVCFYGYQVRCGENRTGEPWLDALAENSVYQL